jgi:uncharacterized protein (TIGR02453 family)
MQNNFMIPATLLPFLKDLRDHNQKEWMDENRKRYESNKSSFELLVEKLIAEIARFDNSISELKPKQCTFRINRDIRFSKNKSPYKTNFAAYFNPNGKQNSGAGYYLHIEPGNCFLAGGIWMPESNELSKIRQEIDYNVDELNALLKKSDFKKQFESGFNQSDKLVRAPKGYEEDNEAIEYLKLKSYIVQKNIETSELISTDFKKKLIGIMKAGKPLVTFINKSLT